MVPACWPEGFTAGVLDRLICGQSERYIFLSRENDHRPFPSRNKGNSEYIKNYDDDENDLVEETADRPVEMEEKDDEGDN